MECKAIIYKLRHDLIFKVLFLLVAPVLIIGLSLAFLWHFSHIWIYGEHLIQEPNLALLIFETIFLGLIFLYGVFLLIKGFKIAWSETVKLGG